MNKTVNAGVQANVDLLLSKLREEDVVIVWKMDRIARSVFHMLKLVEQFKELGVAFRSIQESFMDTTSAHGKFIFTLFNAIAQMERDIIIERIKSGLESTRRRGKIIGAPGISKKIRSGQSYAPIISEKES